MVNGVDVSAAITAESAEDAYEHVLAYAGNGISSEQRTDIDRQVAYESRTGTGTLSGARPLSEASASQLESIEKYSMECGVSYQYPSARYDKIVDSDNDGMEDEWELERGLNPYDAGDVNGDYCNMGYTNIEYYINDLTVDAFPEGVVTASPTTAAIEEKQPETFAIAIKNMGSNAVAQGEMLVFKESDAKLNYWETNHRMTARKEYYITCVMGTDGLEMYCNGVNAGYTGYTNKEETAGRTQSLKMLSQEGTRLFAGGTVNVPDAILGLAKHRLPAGTVIRDIRGSIGAFSARQAKLLYKQARDGNYVEMDVTASASPACSPGRKPELDESQKPDVSPSEKTIIEASREPNMASAVPSDKTEDLQPSYCPAYILGDIDKDGVITLLDAQLTLKYALRLEVPDAYQKMAADMNQDGNISLPDAQLVLKKALRLL